MGRSSVDHDSSERPKGVFGKGGDSRAVGYGIQIGDLPSPGCFVISRQAVDQLELKPSAIRLGHRALPPLPVVSRLVAITAVEYFLAVAGPDAEGSGYGCQPDHP
jgi:hypothetical protein